MATHRIQGVVLYFDEDTGVVNLKRRVKSGEQIYETHLMHIKLESPALSTMSRAIKASEVLEDADNWWIGVKPGDTEVHQGSLFGRNKLIVESIKFRKEKK